MAERDDRGFTLIEVVIVTVMLGLVSLVMGFAITTVLRVTPTAESQVNDARSLQGLTAWFANDAASAARSATSIRNDPPATSLGCTGSETFPGENLVEFRWTVDETTSTTESTTFVAAYRLESDAADRVIRRYECSGPAGSAPYSGTTAQKLTGPLADVGEVTATGGFDRVTLELQSLDGSPINIEATPRSPADTLAAAPPPGAPPQPPDTCVVEFDDDRYPAAGSLARDVSEKLLFGTSLGLTVTGNCGLLTARVDTGYVIDTRPVIYAGLTPGGTRGRVDFPKGDGNPSEPMWMPSQPGEHLVEVFNNCPDPGCTDTPLDTTELVVS